LGKNLSCAPESILELCNSHWVPPESLQLWAKRESNELPSWGGLIGIFVAGLATRWASYEFRENACERNARIDAHVEMKRQNPSDRFEPIPDLGKR